MEWCLHPRRVTCPFDVVGHHTKRSLHTTRRRACTSAPERRPMMTGTCLFVSSSLCCTGAVVAHPIAGSAGLFYTAYIESGSYCFQACVAGTLQHQLDIDNSRAQTPDSCAQLATQAGYTYFALQDGNTHAHTSTPKRAATIICTYMNQTSPYAMCMAA